MANFTCQVKRDFAKAGRYQCSICPSSVSFTECPHTTVTYSPCKNNEPKFAYNAATKDPGCPYKLKLADYEVIDTVC